MYIASVNISSSRRCVIRCGFKIIKLKKKSSIYIINNRSFRYKGKRFELEKDQTKFHIEFDDNNIVHDTMNIMTIDDFKLYPDVISSDYRNYYFDINMIPCPILWIYPNNRMYAIQKKRICFKLKDHNLSQITHDDFELMTNVDSLDINMVWMKFRKIDLTTQFNIVNGFNKSIHKSDMNHRLWERFSRHYNIKDTCISNMVS